VDFDRREPLLGAVVEVALDPSPLGVGGGLNACARLTEVVQFARHDGVAVGGGEPTRQGGLRIPGDRRPPARSAHRLSRTSGGRQRGSGDDLTQCGRRAGAWTVGHPIVALGEARDLRFEERFEVLVVGQVREHALWGLGEVAVERDALHTLAILV
jgi:hypothetical protein